MNPVTTEIRTVMTSRKNRGRVFIAQDFAAFGSRSAVNGALSRLSKAGVVSKVDRSLYFAPRFNQLMQSFVPPSLDQLVYAIARRDDIRITRDCMHDANLCGLTTCVLAQPIFLATTRTKKFVVGGRKLHFKKMPNWMTYWINHPVAPDRPAATVVKAIYWFGQDCDVNDPGYQILRKRLPTVVVNDLHKGVGQMTAWMADKVRVFLA